MSKKTTAIIAVATAATLMLSACGGLGSGKKDDASYLKTKGGKVAYTVGPDPYAGYNGMLSSTYSVGNSAVNDRMASGFGYFLPDGKWHKGGDLGDYEKVSDNPLTIKYTVKKEAVYQGKTPITCEDFFLDWTSQNPKWIMDAQKKAGHVDKQGNPVPLFDSVSDPSSYADPVEKGPECNAGDKTFTVVYNKPNPDWKLNIGGPLPSHVVAKAIGMDKKAMFEALKKHDFAVAEKAAKFWNNWYSKTPGQLPPADQRPSFGPYTLKDGGWKAGEYVTLVRNPDWWGPKGEADELIVKEIQPDAMLQALQNKDVNVIEPQASPETLKTLEGYGKAVTVEKGSNMTWEHLDFNFAGTSIFADDKGGLKLREAFAYCVPRQDIVDKLIKPLNPKAEVMNLREYFPYQPEYKEVLAKAYDGRYDKVDIEKAKKLVEESGIKNPTVRIGYNGIPRRARTVSLIADSCKKAGFTVKDEGSKEFFQPGGGLDSGNYDVALFAWAGSGQITSGANIYMTGTPQNYGKFSDKLVDDEWTKVQTTLDPAVQKAAKEVIEKELWDKLFGIPLYAHPDIVAYTTGLLNVKQNVTQSGVTWNAEKWGWAEKAK